MKRILIIDDDEFKRERVKEQLNKFNNMEYVEIDNCREGVIEILKGNYDYCFLDMGLPWYKGEFVEDPKEGMRILSEIKRKKLNTKVIIYSTTEVDYSEYNNIVIKHIKLDGSYSLKYEIEDIFKEE